ncbi:MAG: hypothetical protein ACRD1R_20045 [Acidobacteriota bacterium]
MIRNIRSLAIFLPLIPFIPAGSGQSVQFLDITKQAGITFEHHSAPDKKYIVESMSSIAIIEMELSAT